MRTLELTTVLIAAVVTTTAPLRSAAQIGRGGDQPAPNAVAAAYRTEVHNKLNQLVIRLAGTWDVSDAGEPTRLYAPNAVIVLGPERTIKGRDAIREAFGSTLRHMRGVVLSIDDYDLSGELAFVRGTMIYELLHDGSPGSQETVSYTMVLRRQRNDEWLVQQQMLGGSIVLPDTKKEQASADRTDVIRK